MRRLWVTSVLASAACQAFLHDDGPTPDTSLAADAAPDAAPLPDDGGSEAAAAPSVCDDRSHRFCDDFENFDETRYTGTESLNAHLSVASDGGLTSPSALAILTDLVTDTSNDCWANLKLKLDGGRYRSATFNARILQQGAGRYRIAEFVYEEALASPRTLELWLNSPDGGLAVGNFVSGGPYNEYPSNEPTFELGQWHEIKWEVDDATSTFSLVIDGTRTAIAPRNFPLPLDAKNPTFVFGAAQVFGPSGTWRIQIDNVRIDDL